MNEWLQKILVNWKKYMLLFFAGIIGFLLLIHFLFKVRTGVYWLEAEWSAGDILSFMGTIFSFVGTLILGCITLKLSQDSNNINLRLVDVETKRDNLEKDKRLGYIIPEKVEIKFYEIIKEEKGDSESAVCEVLKYNCTENTRCIHFILSMKMSSESVINKVICTSVEVYERGFCDNFYNNTSEFCWIPIHKREEKFDRNINQFDKTFDEIILLAECDKSPTGFYELHNIMMKNAEYMIKLEYTYFNTLFENRKETMQIICIGNQIIRNEIVSIE